MVFFPSFYGGLYDHETDSDERNNATLHIYIFTSLLTYILAILCVLSVYLSKKRIIHTSSNLSTYKKKNLVFLSIKSSKQKFYGIAFQGLVMRVGRLDGKRGFV